MEHYVNSEEFWPKYYDLPESIRNKADRRYAILRKHPAHHALEFEKRCDTPQGALYKANVDRQYRALALEVEPGEYVWFWIGTHDEYMRYLDLFC